MELSVVWISSKQGNGILIDTKGNEYYIDNSIPCFNLIKRHDLVTCVVYTLLPDNLLCVTDINRIDHGKGFIK